MIGAGVISEFCDYTAFFVFNCAKASFEDAFFLLF